MRRPSDGKLIGYNTDCEASITAIEDALRERGLPNGEAPLNSPLTGKQFVLVGAGGAGRALAFGARSRGAQLVIFDLDFGLKLLSGIGLSSSLGFQPMCVAHHPLGVVIFSSHWKSSVTCIYASHFSTPFLLMR